mgnify:CR=1 FL=1
MTGGDERLIGSDDEVGACIGERKLSGSGWGLPYAVSGR